MSVFEPQDADFEARVRESFSRQQVMQTLGAELSRVFPGEIDITMPYHKDFTQQHGYLHAGIVATILDSACGYAALTLMEKEAAVLAVEFKANFLAPAAGEQFIARGRVIKAGRTLSVGTGEAFARTKGKEKLVASMQSTVMTVKGRGISN